MLNSGSWVDVQYLRAIMNADENGDDLDLYENLGKTLSKNFFSLL